MPQILHFGIGNFHRAHQAWYTHKLNAQRNKSEDTWRITAVSLRSPTVRDALAPQDCQYTLAIKSSNHTDYTRINVHDDILVGTENRETILAQLKSAETKVITITVSEKGYYTDPATNGLNLKDPAIAEELDSGNPTSLIGYLAHGLKNRLDSDGAPVTIISCDNLPDNGERLAQAVRSFADAAGMSALPDYIQQSVQFPNTMVDRITPATSAALRAEIDGHYREAGISFSDASPVSTEPFSEWIIQDTFADQRPDWHLAGAQFVEDVAPFELRKLRLLNGSHSLLAYAGALKGLDYVHNAIADSELRDRVTGLMEEASTTLAPDIRKSAPKYAESLLNRFENSALNHALLQIAEDGSQKIPVRILSVIQDRHLKRLSSPCALFALKSWLDFVAYSINKQLPLKDPLSGSFKAIVEKNQSAKQQYGDLLNCVEKDQEFIEWLVDEMTYPK